MNARFAVLALLAIAPAGHADQVRDPTRPPRLSAPRAAAVAAGPALTAVFAAGDRRRAIFNGQLVRAGDRVGGYEIDAVLADGIRYRHAGAVHELHLPRPSDAVKKPAAATSRAATGGQ
ncbi:MAG: hypothetical protein JSR73_14260 [Proteobacteria bacterium]|nr:hypothetical protein [Pseudomonadota bacterium]